MGCLFKARINPQSHSLCNLNVFRDQLNFTQMSERKPNITQCKLKTSFYNKSDTAYTDCVVCVFSYHGGLNFQKTIGKINNNRNNELFQWHLTCLACISLQGARSPAITLHNQFPYTDGRNVVVWLIWTGQQGKNNNNNSKIILRRSIIQI